MNKSLICITSCNRLDEIKKNIIPFLIFSRQNKSFDFVLSLDGTNQEYIDFCEQYQIPLLYSEEREGVGISKNRVLKEFPNFASYFFIDDDIELLDESVFERIIEISKSKNINNLSYSVKSGLEDGDLVLGNYGGGCFNFYTKLAIDNVGGWHTKFAKYKRYGHTEHTSRVFFKELNPFPFVALKNISDYILLNNPEHVTSIQGSQALNENELILEEQDLIDSRFSFFPITTLSSYNYNGIPSDLSKTNITKKMEEDRYFLLSLNEKRKALANLNLHYYFINKLFSKLLFALLLNPKNNLLKHYFKQKLKVL